MKAASSAFYTFFRQASGFVKTITALAASVPLTNLVLQIGPPWPSEWVVVLATAICEVFVYMLAFQFLRRRPRALLQHYMLIAMLTCVLGAMAYLAAYSRFVYQAPDHAHRVMGAFTLTVNAEKDHQEKPDRPLAELLADNMYDVDKMWTQGSLMTARIVFLALWLSVIALGVLVFTVFVILNPGESQPPETIRTAE